MGGVHVTLRRTTTKNYIAISSNLRIPTSLNYRSNDSNGWNGAFFEAIYGFFGGNCSLDAGIMYKDGKYRFFGYGTVKSATKWDEDKEFNLPLTPGQTVEFKAYPGTANMLVLECVSGGTSLRKWNLELTSGAYTSLKAGVEIVREIVIAMNEDASGNFNARPGVYFKDAKFARSTLTTATGSYVILSTSNSREEGGRKFDAGFPTTYYDEIRTSVGVTEVGGYVADVVSATTDNVNFPIR